MSCMFHLVAVHDVTSHLQDSIDEDFVAAATNTNDQVSVLRGEMSDKTVGMDKNPTNN